MPSMNSQWLIRSYNKNTSLNNFVNLLKHDMMFKLKQMSYMKLIFPINFILFFLTSLIKQNLKLNAEL